MSSFRRLRRQRLDERTIDALLAGTTPEGHPELSELAAFAGAVRELSAAAPQPDAELAAVFTDGLDDVTSVQPVPVAVPRWRAAHIRSRKMIRALTATLGTALGKVALVSGVAVASVGGAYAAGVDVPGLPEQANDRAVQATDDNGAFEAGDVEARDVESQDVEAQDENDAHGAEVSDFATNNNPSASDNDDWSGRDFGEAISGLASEHGQEQSADARAEAEARAAAGAQNGAEAGRQTGEDRSAEGRENGDVDAAGADNAERADGYRVDGDAAADEGADNADNEYRGFGDSAAEQGQSLRP